MTAAPADLYWMSFADPDLPEGSQSLGIAIVEAEGELLAAMKAHEIGCNPGGEVAFARLPREWLPPGNWIGRLIPPAEARELMASIDRRAAN